MLLVARRRRCHCRRESLGSGCRFRVTTSAVDRLRLEQNSASVARLLFLAIMSLKGLKLTISFDPGIFSKITAANSLISSASVKESFTPSIRATSNMVVRKLCGRCSSASISPCRSSTIAYFVVGTSLRRRSSRAACTLQARTQGALANLEKASGVRATVLTVTLVAKS